MSKRVAIIGIGMDGNTSLTWEAEAAISAAELLIGAKRMLQPFEQSGKEMIDCYQSDVIAACIETTKAEAIAVLMSGDCGFFSGCKTLLPLLADYEVQVISGIASPVYLANRIGTTWQDMHFVSLHGKHASVARKVAAHAKTFFLLGGDIHAKDVCRQLCDYGLEDCIVTVGECLAMTDERVRTGTARDMVSIETEALAVMLVENADVKATRYGIEDTAFVRDKVPMTKAEVRAVCMSKMQIRPDAICYDLGCGSGSVSVEMALACEDGKVYAVDKNLQACELTRKNAHQFVCDNIEVFEGDILGVLPDLPAPDVVFIGGSSNTLSEIVTAVYDKNPKTRIVLTAVSLETVNEAMHVFAKAGRDLQITQIAVTRTHKLGSHTMLEAMNPVFVMTADKEI